MQLSKTTEYALRALVFLKTHPGIQRLEDIAREMDVPEGYLVKVLRVLKLRKAVDTCQGSRGGYQLGCDAEDLTLFEILTYTEKTVYISRCLETGKCAVKDGKRKCSVGTYQVYSELQAMIEEKLKGITLSELADMAKKRGRNDSVQNK